MGKLKRQRKKIKKWWDGYIDFSYLSIEGYQYIKSTYVEGIASGLITEENIEIINKLIPLFNQKEGLFSRFSRLFYERRGKDKELESSFLFRLYCNGFTEAYKNIDKKIKYSTNKLIFPSIKDCKAAVDQYIKELDDRNNCPTLDTKNSSLFREYLLDLGEQEGAIVRFLEYKQEYEEEPQEINLLQNNPSTNEPKKNVGRMSNNQTLPEILSATVTQKPEDILNRIENFLLSKKSKHDIACLKIALEELYYIYPCEVTTFRNSLNEQYGQKIKIILERGIQDAYKELNELIDGKPVKHLKENRDYIEQIKTLLSE